MFKLTLLKRGFDKYYDTTNKEPSKPYIKLEREGIVEYYKLTTREPSVPDIAIVIGGVKHYITNQAMYFGVTNVAQLYPDHTANFVSVGL